MKRSDINRYLNDAKELFAKYGFKLPPFAFWSAGDWETKGSDADEIRSRRLGWDITDFREGRFLELGLTLFTIRNGRIDDPSNRKMYAEKIMVVREGQVTPFHFHWMKTEDIINRGGGELVVELHQADKDEKMTDQPVRVSTDGVVREVKAGGSVTLKPGESITLVPYVYHKFYGKKGAGTCMIGEVSSVNDDATDNRFFDPLPRYPGVEEDASPVHLLCNQYPPAR